MLKRNIRKKSKRKLIKFKKDYLNQVCKIKDKVQMNLNNNNRLDNTIKWI